MSRRTAMLLTGFVALAVILAACGGDEENSTATPLPTTSPTQLTVAQTNPTLEPISATDAVEGVLESQTLVAPAQTALSTVDVVKLLKPSVVQIVTEFSAMGALNQPAPSVGGGTGIILDTQGNILTNNHVIAGAQAIMVTLNDGESFTARLIGGDAATNTAVIRIDADGLRPAKIGRSAELQVGQEVIAIGHALGLPGGPTVSKGVISALGRSIDVDSRTTMVDLIQTDASINPGNSGGPLSNAKGEVIGINSAGIRGSQGIGFAINIDDAQLVVDQLLNKGYVDRGFLGISPVALSPSLASQAGAPVDAGVLIVRTVPGSAAENAGLLAEDVIVQMAGEPIINTGELSKFLVDHLPGETISVVFYRGDEQMTIELILGERPRA